LGQAEVRNKKEVHLWEALVRREEEEGSAVLRALALRVCWK
jgi:hypothetical protein